MFTTPSRMLGTCALLLGSLCFSTVLHGQHMVREWNGVLLQSIRDDLARPTVHARNLHHWSMAVYDAWAAYDSIAEPCLVDVDLPAIEDPVLRREAQEEAINYASFRILWSQLSVVQSIYIKRMTILATWVTLLCGNGASKPA